MKSIIPLAGPDFIISNNVKALTPFNDGFLLKEILDSRPWRKDLSNEDYIFILQNDPSSINFSNSYLNEWFPDSRKVFLSDFTRGAAMSCLAGISLLPDFNEVIILDLADIYYESDIDLLRAMGNETHGLVLTFKSSEQQYSYFKFDEGDFIKAAEKQVISDDASAGTYIFKNISLLLSSLSWSISNPNKILFNDLLYVAPVFNGLINMSKKVMKYEVSNVIDLKLQDRI
jgi:hypothetical protein